MFRPAKSCGDSIAVPQLLFSRLTAQGSDDGRFRVALYVLAEGAADATGVARALRLPQDKVDSALNYWEGAGLLERDAPEAEMLPPPAPRK